MKTWYGKVIENGELYNGTTSYKVTSNKNIALRAVRTWLIVYGSPTLTGLKMCIYSDRGSVGAKLYESTNTLSKDQITTANYALREVYFEFEDPNIVGVDGYYYSLEASSYVASDTNHIAWVVGVDNIYDTDISITATKISSLPPLISFVGASL